MPGPKHGVPRKPGPRKVVVGKTKDGELITKDRTLNKKQAKRLAARQAAFTTGSPSAGLLNHMPGSQNRNK